jgi:hypothetical protein
MPQVCGMNLLNISLGGSLPPDDRYRVADV